MIRRALCLSFCLMASALCASAQCPQLKIQAPQSVTDGEPITFYVQVTGGGRDVERTYNWTVSAGTISSGQGTPAITVDTTGDGGRSVTATVDIGGYPRQCNTAKSMTVRVKSLSARKFDEFGAVTVAERNRRLDNFAIELQNDPTAKGYVIAYAGRGRAPATTDARLRMAATYLIQTRGIVSDRIVTVKGISRALPATELWIVPSGAESPKATPNR